MPFPLTAHCPVAARPNLPGTTPEPDPASPLQRARWLRLSVAALGLAALAACSGKDPATQPGAAGKAPAVAPVGVVVLAPEAQTLSTELPGRTSASQNADIRPQVNGIIQKLLFTEGALVKAGQPLYQVDPATYEAAQASAQAALAKAQATARTAQVNAKRNAELVEIPGVGHLIHYERPEPAAAAISRFLAPSADGRR